MTRLEYLRDAATIVALSPASWIIVVLSALALAVDHRILALPILIATTWASRWLFWSLAR